MEKLNQLKKRIEWVDMSRGFAMILVMLGHTYCAEGIRYWLYTFHVPLFFFLSGYVFSVKKYSSFKEFLISKIKSLFVPMVTLGLLLSVWNYLIFPEGRFLDYIIKKIAGIFIQLRGSEFDLGLWYITCLFVSEIGMWFLIKLTNNNPKKMIFALVGFSIVGFGWIRIIDKICPWCLDAACIAIGFVGSGYLMKTYKSDFINKISTYGWIAIFICINIIAGIINLKLGFVFDLYSNNVSIYPIYYLCGFSGVFACIGIFKKLPKIKALCQLGENTLVFYALHKSVFLTFNFIFEKFKINYGKTTITGLVYIVLASGVLYVISCYIKKYVPWMLGKTALRGGEK